MRSIRWKLIAMTVSLLLAVIIAAGTFIIMSLSGSENANARENLEARAGLIRDLGMKNRGEPESFRAWFNENPLAENLEGAVLDYDGVTIASSLPKSEVGAAMPVYETAVVITALNGEAAFSKSARRAKDADGKERRWLEYAEPVFSEEDNRLQYVVYVRMAVDTIYEYIDQMTRTIAVALVLALVAALGIGAVFANTITAPIILLTKKAKEFAEGKLEEEIPISSGDEIGQMTASFNDMARELSRWVAENIREKNKLEIVLYNMGDGVLAYDESGGIIHYNNAAQELLGIDGVEGFTMAEMLEKLAADVGSHEGETWRDTSLFINGRYLNATFTPYVTKEEAAGANDGSGLVIVLQDVTKHIKLDNMRKEFVANASHEIRTPITTIKSYTETLLDGALDDRETALSFLNTINQESDRMTRIVTDLLDLSKLDSGKIELSFERVNLAELLEENVRNHAITASRAGKTVTIRTGVGYAFIYADASRVNQVLNNIISNSLKYSGEDAYVKVTLEEGNDYFRVYVQDNGIGIPKEDLRHIFERFYRVDKARSRAMGGTGLGLSIAKEIMEAHGGRISAYSEQDKGTTMILRFPKPK